MIPVEEAISRIFSHMRPPETEAVDLAAAHGRVLAAPLKATHSQPPFDASAMDGYAVRASEVMPGQALKLAGTSQAGSRFVGMMERGQCVRIFTGAPIPIGADAVVIQEETIAKGNHVTFERPIAVGQNIRKQGFDFLRGAELLPAGTALSPAMLALAASANQPKLTVNKRPRLAILATGDELVAPGATPGPDQIVASNSYGVAAMLSPLAASVMDLGIVPDDKGSIEEALLKAFDAGIEVVVTSGGASVGERDLMQQVLRDLGVKLDFWKLKMRPGKPLMFGTRGRSLIFGLPGNPVSALVTTAIILKPALKKMGGHADPFWPRFVAPITAGLPPNGPRRQYLRGTFERNEIGFLQVRPIAETDSGHSSSLARADALIVQPEDDPGMPPGEMVDVIPLDWG